MTQPAAAQALVFDVFGTVVDWRGSIIQEGEKIWQARDAAAVDWAQFADEWRAGYAPAMNRVRRGEIPWATIDTLHRQILDTLLARYGLTHLTDTERDDLNRVWHRLHPWPDAVEGLARFGGLTWDCILSAELARRYKPDPEVYQMAAELLGLPPQQVMMVAAHSVDLRAAQAVGMQTALVRRPLEFGPAGQPDLETDPTFTLAADDFHDLAAQLGL